MQEHRERTDGLADQRRNVRIAARFHRQEALRCFDKGLTHPGRRHELIADRLEAAGTPLPIDVLTPPPAQPRRRAA
ncbi:hypothetical protein [Azospirillum canadense]|uniref:hypothetical protein n=1 Tax=Azospirillum canadense TaxID=403962 RepID=UPI002227C53A|nr:hypothetical protein [Azospirillum canadense]MCW2243603.1 hypothetical protein [Azospirillum canadense]